MGSCPRSRRSLGPPSSSRPPYRRSRFHQLSILSLRSRARWERYRGSRRSLRLRCDRPGFVGLEHIRTKVKSSKHHHAMRKGAARKRRWSSREFFYRWTYICSVQIFKIRHVPILILVAVVQQPPICIILGYVKIANIELFDVNILIR